MDAFIGLAITLGLIALGFFAGRVLESRHLAELTQREAATASIVVVDVKTLPPGMEAATGTLVMGEVVIASDYFKTFAASLRNIVGGEVKSYQTMLSRARREARLRMVEQARDLGSNLVVNVRFEWSAVGPGLYYLTHIWWSKMIRLSPPKRWVSELRTDRIVMSIWVVVAGFGAATLGGIFSGDVLGALWMITKLIAGPFLAFCWFIGWTVYVHHIHERLHWARL